MIWKMKVNLYFILYSDVKITQCNVDITWHVIPLQDMRDISAYMSCKNYVKATTTNWFISIPLWLSQYLKRFLFIIYCVYLCGLQSYMESDYWKTRVIHKNTIRIIYKCELLLKGKVRVLCTHSHRSAEQKVTVIVSSNETSSAPQQYQ